MFLRYHFFYFFSKITKQNWGCSYIWACMSRAPVMHCTRMFATLGQAAQNWTSGKIGHGGWHILTYEPQPHLFYISCAGWNMEAATTKSDGGHRGGGWWVWRLVEGHKGVGQEKMGKKMACGRWRGKGWGWKTGRDQLQEEEAHHHHSDLWVWSVSKATYHPATPHYPSYPPPSAAPHCQLQD